MISAALGLATSVMGGIMANKAARKQQKLMREAQQQKINSFNRRYNENGLQRASAQAALNRVQDEIARRAQQAQGAQAVMGGSEASVASTKEANAQALANTASNILANEDARKDALQKQMDSDTDKYNQQQAQLQAQKTQALASAVSQAGSAIGAGVEGALKFAKKDNNG
mgnify:CR=1 FL=1